MKLCLSRLVERQLWSAGSLCSDVYTSLNPFELGWKWKQQTGARVAARKQRSFSCHEWSPVTLRLSGCFEQQFSVFYLWNCLWLRLQTHLWTLLFWFCFSKFCKELDQVIDAQQFRASFKPKLFIQILALVKKTSISDLSCILNIVDTLKGKPWYFCRFQCVDVKKWQQKADLCESHHFPSVPDYK